MRRVEDPLQSSRQGGRHLADPDAEQSGHRATGWVVLIALALVLVAIAGTLVVTRSSRQYGGTGAAAGGGCGGSHTPLEVVAAPELAGLIQQASADYLRDTPTVDGTCVAVHVQGMESASTLEKLAKGWPDTSAGTRPDVWVPSSSAWANLLALRLQAGGRGAASMVTDPQGSIATSPLVVAMPRPMAQALGWPDKQPGWGDLLSLLRNPAGWGAAGHREWGEVKFGQTTPNHSTPALQAVLGAMLFAGSGGQPLTLDTLSRQSQSISALLAGLGSLPGPHEDLPSDLLTALRRADEGGKALQFVSAAFLSEQQVWAYNHGDPGDDPAAGQHAAPKVPLSAIYPKEGTLQSDYPWTVLDAPWVSDAKHAAAADFLRFLRQPAAQSRFQAAGFRSASGTAGAEFSQGQGVLAAGPSRVVSAPGAEIVTAVLQAWNQAGRATNLLVVFDVSGSMAAKVPAANKTKMDLVKAAGLAALQLIPGNFEVAFWLFATHLSPQHPWVQAVPLGTIDAAGPGGVTTRQQLAAAARKLAPTHFDTALYDTTWDACQYIKQHYRADRRNAVAILTDGINDNPDGGLSLAQLLQKLQAGQAHNPVSVFTIGYGADVDANALRKIADATGGAFFASPDPRGIQSVLVRMAAL
jgi:Ca-activated chloride channel family protein